MAKKVRKGLHALALAALLIVANGGAIGAQQARDVNDHIRLLRLMPAGDRIAGAKFLVENWQIAQPELVKAIAFFDRPDGVGSLTPDDVDYFRAITDVQRTIILNKEGAIQKFRTTDNNRATRALVWASRASDRDLRLNATYILADVTDNTNVCIVFHHLRDRNLSANGRVNLLQVAATVAGYSYKENVSAAMKTIEILRGNLGLGCRRHLTNAKVVG
jgi:hypothetical protein